MVQRIRLVSAIGKQGKARTEYEIRGELVREAARKWTLSGTVRGTGSSNYQFERPIPSWTYNTVDGSVRTVKGTAVDRLKALACNFLQVHANQLVFSNSTTWTDHSD